MLEDNESENLKALIVHVEEVLRTHGSTNLQALTQQLTQALVQGQPRHRSGRRLYDKLRDVLMRNNWKAH